MKVAVVSSQQIHRTPGLRLDAGPYAHPTAKIDEEIAAAERALDRAVRRLQGLQDRRTTILEEFKP